MKKPQFLIPILCLVIGILIYMMITSFKSTSGTYTSLEKNVHTPLAWLKKNPIPEPNYNGFPHEQTVTPDGGVTNRSFHDISWQYFLWLTEEIEIGKGTEKMLRFETMHNDASINLTKNDTKGLSHILGGIQQAGSNSVLVDENHRAVYTTMIIDDNYRDFVTENNLNVPSSLRKFPDSTNFPNGSMSMKAAWKVIPKDKKAPIGAYTRKAELYKVVEIEGNLTTSDTYKDTDKHETVEETVALVGFHIAVVVEGHPEFIWATFEHNENAINYILKNESERTNYTFFNNFNVSNTGALKVNPKTQEISQDYVETSTTQVVRMHQYGGGTAENQNNIEILNKEIRKALPNNSFAKYYHEVGAVWFNEPDALVPNWSLTVNDSLQTGSKTLSNAVIETFTQDNHSQNSCFSCHNTLKYNPVNGLPIDGKNVLTSHILLKNYINAQSDEATLKAVNRTN